MYIQKKIIQFALTTFLLPIAVAACNQASAQHQKYGEIIQYAQGQPLHYPDLTLEFLGIKEHPPSDLYPRSMYAYEFEVSQGSLSQVISWSSGTGDIGPTYFELSGKTYALELALSDELGMLEKGELVLWRVDE